MIQLTLLGINELASFWPASVDEHAASLATHRLSLLAKPIGGSRAGAGPTATHRVASNFGRDAVRRGDHRFDFESELGS